MTKQLITTETLDAKEVFTGENPTLDSLIQQVRDEVADFKADVTTEEGRKDIAAKAYMVTRSKTALEALGKEFVAGIKSQAKVIDDQRKSMRETLEELAKEVRKPLNEWEEEEKRKEEALEGRFLGLKKYTENADLDLQELKASLEMIKDTVIDESWSYLEEKAQELKNELISVFTRRIEEREKHDKEQAELEQFRKDKVEREEKDRLADAESARIKREEEITKNATKKAEQDTKDAEERAEQAEQRRVQDLADAEAKAETDKQAAVEAEKKRAAAETQRLADEEAKRAANKKHNAKINNKAKEALIVAGLSDQAATQAVTAIAKGMIPNVAIRY